MKRSLLLLAFCVFFFPAYAEAVQEETWSFRNSQIPGEWTVGGWGEVVPTKDGVHIRAQNDGNMLRTLDLPFPVDLVTLVFGDAPPTSGLWIWHPKDSPPHELIQLPFTINDDDGPAEAVTIDLTTIKEWDSTADRVGIALSAGSDVVLQEIRFSRWSFLEKIAEAAKTYWHFDEYRPYSINFLWGPQLAYNPVSRLDTFNHLPPRTQSGNRVLYALLGLVGLGLLIHRFIRGRGEHLGWFLIVIGLVWVFFDFRMGTEILSYVRTDYQTYISQTGTQRSLRAFLNSHAVMETALQSIPEERFGLLMPGGTGVPALVRYLGYPRMPVLASAPDLTLRHWIIFKDDRVTVNGNGELTVDGVVFSKPGRIAEQYEPNSFLFETNP